MSEEQPLATVFVVDDDPNARKSVCALAQSIGYLARAFESGEEFLDSGDLDVPGCLVTDLHLHGMSGAAIQAQLTQKGIKLPVIVISGQADVPATVHLMRQGAITLLQKPYESGDLVRAIHRAINRDRRRREHDLAVRDAWTRLAKLSGNERDVLRGIVSGRSNKQIAFELDIGLRTVERRRRQVLDKLDVSSITEVIQLLTLDKGISNEWFEKPQSNSV